MIEFSLLTRYQIKVLMDEIMFKSIFAVFAAIIFTAYSAIHGLVYILLLLMMIDFILEFWVNWNKKHYVVLGLYKIIVKLILYAISCLVVALATQAISESLGSKVSIDIWFVCLMCINETLSCLSNLSQLGLPVPQWILEKLRAIQEDPTKIKK